MRRCGAVLVFGALVVSVCGTTAGDATEGLPNTPTAEATPTLETVPTLVGTADPTEVVPPATTATTAPGVGGAGPDSTPGPTTTEPATGAAGGTTTEPTEPSPGTTPPDTTPPEAGEWQQHPLAAAVLDATDLGDGWQRTSVVIVEPTTGGSGEQFCGIDEPASPGGLEAGFERDDLSSAQIIAGTGPEAPATVEAFRLAIDCEFGGDLGPGATVTEIDMTTLDADDAVGARIAVGGQDESGIELSMTFVVLRWGDLLVAVSAGSFGSERPITDAEILDLAATVRSRLAEAGALS